MTKLATPAARAPYAYNVTVASASIVEKITPPEAVTGVLDGE